MNSKSREKVWNALIPVVYPGFLVISQTHPSNRLLLISQRASCALRFL